MKTYWWVADPRQVTLDSGHPWPSPFGLPSAVQIRSHRICLCLSKDNFAGSKIGRALRARRARATDGAGQKSPKEKTPRSRRHLLSLLGKIGARLIRRALKKRASGSNRSLANAPRRAAMLGGYGNLNLESPVVIIDSHIIAKVKRPKLTLVILWAIHCGLTVLLTLWSMGWAMTILDSPYPKEVPAGLIVLNWMTIPFSLPLLWPTADALLALGFSDPLHPIYWLLPPINSLVDVYLGWVLYRRKQAKQEV
jgi:hypothetical protein